MRGDVIYLSGAVRSEFMGHPAAGVILTPMMGNRPDLEGTWWAADTGCFAAPERFDLAAYLDWLGRLRPFGASCLFATAPDVVGDSAATWAKSGPVLPLIRQIGYKAALVAQDGLETMSVDWGTLDCLFIGGTTAWKLSEAAYGLIGEAKRRGKHVHAGRVNSLRRLRAMAVAGADSADGTFVKWGPDVNTPKVMRWLEGLRVAPTMRLLASW